jgi:hypothetical protein
MGTSDWITVAVAALGLAMTGLGQRIIRVIGIILLIIAVGGAVFTHFYPHADAQGGNCNNYGPNGTIISSCNTTVVSPPHDAAGLYQGAARVGRVQGPVVDEARGVVSFQALVFNDFPDPAQPLEYGKLLLACNGAPHRQPNTVVGNFSAVIAGAQCRIVGKTP